MAPAESENRDLRATMRRALGRIFLRLEGFADDLKAERRRHDLEQGCRADPSSVFGPAATVINCRREPDNIVVGPNCSVMGQLTTFPAGGRIVLRERVFVGEGSRIWSACSVEIGRYVLISHNVNIYDNNSHSRSWRQRRQELDVSLPTLNLSENGHDLDAKPIVIEDDVWIGFNAMVKGGVRIGRGAIVGAGTFVTADVPPFSVAVGNPMRIVEQSADALGTATD